MRTLGIDLASQPAKTAACRIDWIDGRAVVAALTIGVTDDDIAAFAAGCDATGIDAPFGWPAPFVAFLCRRGGPEPATWDAARRTALSYRRTDLSVWRDLRRPPLSVAADRIALPAMRCAGLLDRLGVTDRAGDGRVFEVYPAAALHAWGLASRGYKAPRAGTRPASDGLPALLGALRDQCPWLDLPPEAAARCARDDDAFDDLVSALVARVAVLGLATRPGPEDAERARVEGWIAVPAPDSLDALASGR